jgi:hypothetical protein
MAKVLEVPVASETPGEAQPDPAQAMAYLRTRSLYVATPAYGGWLAVNYINSLMGLLDLCKSVGVKYTVSFKYNESLITRARNSMVHDFMKDENQCTDFVFIDADIGFDPRDIVSMLLYKDREVIGAPCVRKSFNWQRIYEIIKASDKPISPEELEKMTGEFVINFPHDAQPTGIKLSELTEVQDVGTGIMRIKREVLERIQKKYPERWYLPLMGEGDKEPMYMFFQAEQDFDTAKFNPGGLPDYIPEDFSFCRLCKKTDTKIWIAPWMKTTHMGSYMFKGDMLAVAQAGGRLR